jgi:intracellular multiplication protein IcmJ
VALLPIALGVRQTPDAGKPPTAPPKTDVESALVRDNYTCRFCGFRSKQYQRVIANPDGDPALVTSCTFCEQCLMLERAGITGAGLLIWLPEIEQPELNNIARAIYVARADKSEAAAPAAQHASRALDALTARRAEAKKRLGSDDPMLLATIMHEALSAGEQKQAADKLKGVRLLPGDKHMVRTARGDANHFPLMIAYWRSPNGPFGKKPPSGWAELFKRAASAAGHA